MAAEVRGVATVLLILGIVGLVYAIAQAMGDLPAISGISDLTLAFFAIVGIAIGAYYGSE